MGIEQCLSGCPACLQCRLGTLAFGDIVGNPDQPGGRHQLPCVEQQIREAPEG
jgi:hypothetical protein